MSANTGTARTRNHATRVAKASATSAIVIATYIGLRVNRNGPASTRAVEGSIGFTFVPARVKVVRAQIASATHATITAAATQRQRTGTGTGNGQMKWNRVPATIATRKMSGGRAMTPG